MNPHRIITILFRNSIEYIEEQNLWETIYRANDPDLIIDIVHNISRYLYRFTEGNTDSVMKCKYIIDNMANFLHKIYTGKQGTEFKEELHKETISILLVDPEVGKFLILRIVGNSKNRFENLKNLLEFKINIKGDRPPSHL